MASLRDGETDDARAGKKFSLWLGGIGWECRELESGEVLAVTENPWDTANGRAGQEKERN